MRLALFHPLNIYTDYPVAVDTIRVAKAKARHTGDLEEVVCRRMWQKLGLLVQKGNCALFNNRVPDIDNQV